MTGVHDWFFYLFSFSIRRRPAGLFSLFTRAPSSGSHLNWYSESYFFFDFGFTLTKTSLQRPEEDARVLARSKTPKVVVLP